MSGLITDLSVAGRLAARTLGRRLRSDIEAAPDLDAFSREMTGLLGEAPPGVIKDHVFVDIDSQQPPWLPGEVHVEAGDEISYFMAGRVYANKLLDIYVTPAVQLWCRIGNDGEVFRGTRSSHSFRAETSGPLMFGNYFPNDWIDKQGNRKQSDDVYKEVSGGLRVLIIKWEGSAIDGLRALQACGDPQQRLGNEIQRCEQGDITPDGWQYLWHLGPAEIYRLQAANGDPARICCQTHGDVGILQKDIDLPLDEDTEISWRWCVAQLPSSLREDSLPTHDYLSIAVEFDNGRDITYYWSGSLPPGTGYDCPLPNWQGKEYHVVVRSGAKGLGQWQDERRNLYTDYQHYMGEPPARVVRVWLIANSIFQRGEGRCDYEDIVLHNGGQETRLL